MLVDLCPHAAHGRYPDVKSRICSPALLALLILSKACGHRSSSPGCCNLFERATCTGPFIFFERSSSSFTVLECYPLPPLGASTRNWVTFVPVIGTMAGIASRPLAMLRKPDSPKQLHSRWGDVAISVPTDGSWNQYDNPHRPAPGRQTYGPGYVLDCSPSDRKKHPPSNDDAKEDNESTLTRSTSISHRNSLSLGSLRPGRRLSVRLTSRPKHPKGETPAERHSHQAEPKKLEFAYKPIQQDYPAEATENSSQSHTNRYRYIPTSGRYLEDIPSAVPRRQSASSYRSCRTRWDSFSESQQGEDRGRESKIHTMPARPDSQLEDERRSLRSSVGDISDSSGSRLSFWLPPRRKTSPVVASDQKRLSSLKPMTLAMVPDREKLHE